MRPFSDGFLERLSGRGRRRALQSVGAYQLEGWAPSSSAGSRATISPSSACRCCRCSDFLRDQGVAAGMSAEPPHAVTGKAPGSPASSAGRSPIPARRGCTATGSQSYGIDGAYLPLRGAAGAAARRRCAALPLLGFRRRQRHRAPQGGGAGRRRPGDARRRGASAPSTRIVVGDGRHARGQQHRRLRLPRTSCGQGGAALAGRGRARPWCSAPAARRGRSPSRWLDAGVPEIRLVNRTARARRTPAPGYRRADQA